MTSPVGVFPILRGTVGTSCPWNKGTDCGTIPDCAGPALTASRGSPLMRQGEGWSEWKQ